MVLLGKIPDSKTSLKTPLLSATVINISSGSSSESEQSPPNSNRIVFKEDSSANKIDRFSVILKSPTPPTSSSSYKSLAILSGHIGSVSCLAICDEFVLSASQGKDIIVWQQPDLKKFAKFGHGDGSVKALVTVGNRVFTAHQHSRIIVWKVSRSS